MEKHIRINNIMEISYSNGPFKRYTIWFQGCERNCKGCFNPETHDIKKGYSLRISELINDILSYSGDIEGLTFSGGEPFLQFNALLNICKKIRKKTNLGIIILTGYTAKELYLLEGFKDLCNYCDLIIAGPFVQEMSCSYGLKGSSNKECIFLSERYTRDQIEGTSVSEFKLKEGDIYISGIRPEFFLKGYKNRGF